jgi:hypothetical protein
LQRPREAPKDGSAGMHTRNGRQVSDNHESDCAGWRPIG